MTEQEKREKVIRGLECCVLRNPEDRPRCNECPYDGACLNRLKHDALALLKAQEAVKPIECNGFYYCGTCRHAFIVNRQKYCTDCGKAVKWE